MDVTTLAFYGFVRALTQRLVDKGVFTTGDMVDLYDVWFSHVLALGAELEAAGSEQDVDDILQIIHSLADEFTPK